MAVDVKTHRSISGKNSQKDPHFTSTFGKTPRRTLTLQVHSGKTPRRTLTLQVHSGKRLTGPSVLVHSGKTADWTLSTSTFGNKMHQSVHVWYLPTTVSHCLHSSDVSKSAACDQVLTSAFQITYCATLSLHVDPLRNYGINTLSRPMLACLLRAETSLQNNLNMMGVQSQVLLQTAGQQGSSQALYHPLV